MSLGHARGFPLDCAIALDELAAERRKPRAAAMRPAKLRRHHLATKVDIHLLDEHPSAAIGHAEVAPGAADRAAFRDGLKQPDLAWADRLTGAEIDAQGEAWRHATRPRRRFRWAGGIPSSAAIPL